MVNETARFHHPPSDPTAECFVDRSYSISPDELVSASYGAIANGIQTIHSTRFLPPDVIAMHPRRWGWFTSLLDGNQRPLFLPTANGLMNAAGVVEAVASQQVVGQIQGLPVITDPNIPVNLGAGNNEDVIFVMRASDLVLWEDSIRARVLPEVKAQNLTVVLQIYNYFAFTASRRAWSRLRG